MIEHLPTLDAQRVLCTSAGRAQAAFVAARRWPSAEVECLYLDLYRAELARAAMGECPTNLAIRCDVDFQATDVDLAVLPLSSTGEAELTRELLQSAFVRLKMGGTLLASTDNVRDSWLGDELAKLERRVERIVAETAWCIDSSNVSRSSACAIFPARSCFATVNDCCGPLLARESFRIAMSIPARGA